MTEPSPKDRLPMLLNTVISGYGALTTTRAEGRAEYSTKLQRGVELTVRSEGGVMLSMEPKGGTALTA